MQQRDERGLVTVIGGSGFLGRHVVRALARRGYRLRVAMRNPAAAAFLQPIGRVGQILPMQANLRFPDSIAAAVAGADAVVNLVGILHERGSQTFAAVHVDGARAVAEAAAAARVQRLVHVSALNADAAARSRYRQTKAAGEAAVTAAFAGAAIMRPAPVFGAEDSLFNRIARLARVLPALPLIGGATRFQPVFAGDVAEAVARAVDGSAAPLVYELGGPQVLTQRALFELTLRQIHRHRPLVPVPFGIARLAGTVLQRLPGHLLSADEVDQLRQDVVVSETASEESRTLEGLGISPAGLTGILPGYLVRYRPRGQFSQSPAAD
ncbi:MAG: complex I NDUFA9 subunit family protein [Bauldia sp.]